MKNLLVFLTVLQIGHSLNCYKCNGCEGTSLSKETCKNVDPDVQTNSCLTQKIRISGADTLTIKKCIAYDKSERFKCPTIPTGETFFCHTCDSDFCNSATKVTRNFSLYLTLLGLILVPNFLYN